ncbi:thioredoxin family protein [Demequina sp. NBRC 110056]|uniref:thioredoxin family protein n=1 Tax=Demequina sp. NBRC 110056 TaxID=1570345 RepID=UPI0009FF81A3|nr:thioredoxin family protein [Demequina sp. NBRC 110056]
MLERALVIVALLAVASLGYWWWQRRQGRVRALSSEDVLTAEQLGAPRGAHATFVQFSTPMCSKCPGTARLLRGVAEQHVHVTHLEIDASERLDLARELSIMRTPTTLVLDGDGAIVARMDGAPTVEQAQQALAAVASRSDGYAI